MHTPARPSCLRAGQHLEEVKHLSGTITRLKDKLAAAEKEAAVAHTLKVRPEATWEENNCK
jgi:hypothetical protein